VPEFNQLEHLNKLIASEARQSHGENEFLFVRLLHSIRDDTLVFDDLNKSETPFLST
jgi:hypothetical protein